MIIQNRHIVIICELVFTKRDYGRAGVEILSQYYNVRVLNLSPLIRLSYHELRREENFTFKDYYEIGDISEVYDTLVSLPSGSIVIDYMFEGNIQTQIRRYCRANQILLTKVSVGTTPVRLKGSIINTLVVPPAKYLFRNYYSLRCKIRDLIPIPNALHDISIWSGNTCKYSHYWRTPYRIPAHSFDYDLYLRYRESVDNLGSPYVIFLDQNLGLNHDRIITGTKPVVSSDYYQRLEAFFDLIENDFGIPVKIAGHPKARYNHQHPLRFREIINDDTPRLVKSSSLVLAHYTTSISFAVLWRKPIILMTTDEMINKNFIRRAMGIIHEELNAQILNIDQDTHSLPLSLMLNRKELSLYEKYQSNHIKVPGTPDIPLWEIFSNTLTSQSIH